jgi:hypothetical protein
VHKEPNAISSAIDYAKFHSRSHDAVIRVFDEAGNVIETQEHSSDFHEHEVVMKKAAKKPMGYSSASTIEVYRDLAFDC